MTLLQPSPRPAPSPTAALPLTATTLLRGRDPSLAHIRYTNPTAGTHFIVPYLASLRDTDQDGFENALDTCPKQPNAGNPKTGTGDPDGDGLDDACDPSPAALDPDPDGDIHVNRADKCPLDANPGQPESEAAVIPPDRGPRRDELGDPCDTGTIPVTQNGRTFNLTLSPSVANGRYHAVVNNVPKCYGATPAGGTDADGDGYCSSQDMSGDSGGCAPGTCHVRHNPWNNSYASALMSAIDSDDDTWTDPPETYMGTDQTKSCAFDSTPNNEGPLDHWPMDFNDDGRANTSDVGGYISRLSRLVNQPPATPRWDLNFDGLINSVDVGRFVPVLNKTCAQMLIPPWSQQ